jgi:hypothetical protein
MVKLILRSRGLRARFAVRRLRVTRWLRAVYTSADRDV